LSALGQRTRRVDLGTSVLAPTFRLHPAVVAQAAMTVACLTPGRLLLGLGSGEPINEMPALGIAWPPFGERLGRLKEGVDIVQRLWSGDFVDYQGEYFELRGARLYDRSQPLPPVLVAASGAQAAELAGRSADGLLCTSATGVERLREVVLPALARGAAMSGREPSTLIRVLEVKVAFDSDLRRARAETEIWAALDHLAVKTGDPRELERLGEQSHLRAPDRWLIADDAERQLEQLEPFLALGFDHVVFHSPAADQRRFLELFAGRVLPGLRARRHPTVMDPIQRR
jgi:coenzyme F420-dependent glucose-6-phosphate dehydrogenase